MPVRDNLKAATYSVRNNGVTYLNNYPGLIGSYQYISAFNNAGTFTPGKFRVNSVRMKKISASCSPCSSQNEDKYLANKGTFSGDAAAYLVGALNRAPVSANYDMWGAWNSTPAGLSLQKAYAKVNEAQFDLGVVLGELKETFAGFAKPFGALRQYFNLWNRIRSGGKGPGMGDTLNMLSGSWLEWWYGIYPNIKTIDDLIKHVQSQAMALDGKMLRKRGSVVETPAPDIITGGTYPQFYYVEGSVKTTVHRKYTSSVYYVLERPLTFAETYGLDVPSWPGIAWELLTLSFVWDWFFGVGSWLGAIKPTSAFRMLGSSTSLKATIETTVPRCKLFYYGIVPSTAQGSSYSATVEILDRRSNQTLPYSPLVDNSSLSLKRQIDAISLLWQNLPKLRR